MPHVYEYPRPALTVDCVVFGWNGTELQILLIERKLEPFRGWWALPGGFVGIEETLEAAARRELHEETGVSNLYLEQLHAFDAVDRDPRDRTISVAFYALVKPSEHTLSPQTDAESADWFPASRPPRLAFDHRDILQHARDRLRTKIRHEPVGFELLPPRFTLSQVQRLYEAILDSPLDKRNFRRRILEMGVLLPLNERQAGVAHRRAQLYRFDQRRYRQRLKQRDFVFEL